MAPLSAPGQPTPAADRTGMASLDAITDASARVAAEAALAALLIQRRQDRRQGHAAVALIRAAAQVAATAAAPAQGGPVDVLA